MKILLIWLSVLSFAEVLLWLPPLWRVRRVLACLLIVPLSIVSGLLFGSHPVVWTGLLLLLSIYRLINLLRVLEGRLESHYLFRATRRTSYWLISWQIIVTGVAWLNYQHPQSGTRWLYLLSGLQLLAALVLFGSTRRHMRTTQPLAIKSNLADQDLPTLSVAIPARNETNDLETCLQSLVSSNYPKLEILVLDDCSQNKRTPGIIRDFAQSGVRFIAGKTPPDHWLAKNYAYQQLSGEANGELLLFCGVDTRFQPGSLRAMVEVMLQKNKTMVSFIPQNKPPGSWNLAAVLFQPSRYAWELALPRRLFKRAPVLSTCWLISRKVLQSAGSFEAVSHSISPESYFARYTARHNDGYSFLQSNTTIGLASLKSVPEQRATAIRTRYPQLHRRPELVALMGVIEITGLVLPFLTLVICVGSGYWLGALVSVVACVLLVIVNVQIVSLTYRKFLWRGLWILPLAVAHDVAILNYSMWQYEFREVIWKGRNVCVPLMQAAQPSQDWERKRGK